MRKPQFSETIKSFNFKKLFNELGWDHFDNTLPVVVGEEALSLTGVAEKRGFAVMQCPPLSNGAVPNSSLRQQIQRRVAKHYHENLLIYTDRARQQQVWQLVTKEENQPRQVHEVTWHTHQDVEILFQRLKNLLFTIDEEEKIFVVDVKQRVSENFAKNTEKVTKKFYAEFKKQHTDFLAFIQGIDDHLIGKENANKQWYASLMLNRLMFCYFIQKKGFLDQNLHYLQHKLATCQDQAGQDNFYGFYRSFLLQLFHSGLGKPENKRTDPPPVDLGKIPYLNGGLFDVHELERQFEQIHISDDAFKKIFDFFDQWNWHLDNRVQASGRDINPDVIGYIFEKYINDRAAMGAYYTKEDITDYIGKNTILPFLFDETRRKYSPAFQPEAELWRFLADRGDTYVYDAMKHGVPPENDLFTDLPEEISAGFRPDLESQVVEEATAPHLWELRQAWNQRAPEAIGLPTETFRELIERRKRYAELVGKIKRGEITQISDFITYNLNIRQFAQDFIEQTEDAAFVRHFYRAIRGITILDPTCGSGAFLFAALNILEPLYEACLTRMEQWEAEAPGQHPFFADTLAEIANGQHPNRQYYIYKSIILNNLYGVDLMKEAVEIAKLRLFLKLVATVDLSPRKENFGLEPLPDIDFNIRAGNTLVGFATEQELLETIQKKEALFAQEKLDEFKEDCWMVSQAYAHFQDAQRTNDQGSDSFKQSKNDLRERLEKLNDKLNVYLATNYGIDAERKPKEYQAWYNSHQPFHWFAEFYRIVAENGGFDVIVGNPPYVEIKDLKEYKPKSFNTFSCGNLYAVCYERCISLYNRSGKIGLIIPVASICTDRYKVLQDLLLDQGILFASSYNDRPSKLFEGLEHIRLSIVIAHKADKKTNYSTKYLKWNSIFREYLFDTVLYEECTDITVKKDMIPKIGSSIAYDTYEKISSDKKLSSYVDIPSKHKLYYTRKLSGFVQILDFVPEIYDEEDLLRSPSELKTVEVESETAKRSFLTLLNSSLFYWLLTIWSDCRNLNKREVLDAPLTIDKLSYDSKAALSLLCDKLFTGFRTNSEFLEMNFKNAGKLRIQCIYPKKSKPIIDQIDTVLAQHYGFTEEELDFIINYDIKYRMGKALFGEDDHADEDE